MTLKDRIESELRKACPTKHMGQLLQVMEKYGYYSCSSSSHNNWRGGAAEHMWACYQIAKSRKTEILKAKPYLLNYATDEKLAIVCLLHDLCDMNIPVRADQSENFKNVSCCHGNKSYWIMKNHHVGTDAEQKTVLKHMHKRASSGLEDRKSKEEYEALHTIICAVDHMAAGCAWNSELFKKGLTQHRKVESSLGYLRSVALDRTLQCLLNHIYMDNEFCPNIIYGINRDNIVWNTKQDVVNSMKGNDMFLNKDKDMITLAHEKIASNNGCCLVIGVDSKIPDDCNKRLRSNWKHEQDLLICSNLLNSLYYRDQGTNTSKKHHYGFTMNDSIKQKYRQQSDNKGILLPQVTFFRDGESKGFQMVKPWKCDVVLVPGWKGCDCMEI